MSARSLVLTQLCPGYSSREFVRIQKVEQIKQLADIVVQGRAGQEQPMDRVELSQAGEDEGAIRLDCPCQP
jgi:hypothetical protein